ncbi:Protein of unknown function (DUF3592) [Actinokineospora globicatena]|uniref:DUF3592 domain-containing protein n=2 Tax=Actinokineospora globicatena TaxID=103729 RepID=A0A9W6VCJ7_9PSEU|nr:Protein of unknown function (DUF3592) [Actinokineospora globicatena]GLW78023.1 hypothetical protein Aglo01_25050 [Actinokineospora globicatena]GLW85311.1 hypothetical protein Aglo02_29510 [Actinokineospora globicatena]GLW94068.1 hypothetical protein Aglo03_48840 [Actinokineospora globicatena]
MGDDHLTTTAAAGAVRRALLRSVVVLVLGVALVVVGGLLDAAAEDQRSGLLADGVRVPGVVVRVEEATRVTSASIDVRFAVDGQDRVRTLTLLVPDPPPRVDDRITLFYDPADPERVASAQAGTEPPAVLEVGYLVAASLGVVLVVAGAVLSVRWLRRLRSVRSHGWRPGTATVESQLARIGLDARGEVFVDTGRVRARTGRVLLGGSGSSAVIAAADGRVVAGREVPGPVT